MTARPASLGRKLAALAILLAWLVGAGPVAAQTADEREAALEAEPERLQFGISVDTVPVTSAFAGIDIVVFGTIENADRLAQVYNEYAVVVVIRGPAEEVVVRRKERTFGIWVNRQARRYRNVPSFYTVASNRPLPSVADPAILRRYQLGVDNMSLSLFSSGNETFILPAPEFAASLRRIRRQADLFAENPRAIRFLGSSLFRATLQLPSNVPIGTHDVTTYLFRNGEMIASRVGSFEVRKVGFEKWLYALAHEFSLWYGLLAVLVALFTGWLGSVIFGNRQ